MIYKSRTINSSMYQNGFLSSMPYVIMLMLIPTGRLFDWLRSTKKVRLITLRRIYNTIGKTHRLLRFRDLIIDIAFCFS